MTAKVILNPYAGRWTAAKRQTEVESALREAGIDYELAVTEHSGHGTVLASQAVREGFSHIIAAGGDGSISEVVNGIVNELEEQDANELPPFGILPLGSANDLVVNLGLPTEIAEAAQVIGAGNIQLMDLGQVSFDNNLRTRVFDNNSAIGLEPSITLIQERISWLRGVLRYIVATLIGIAQNPQWRMRIEWDNGEYYGPITLVTVGINPLTGGVFYMTPHADPFDGLLTFVYGSMPTRLQILRLLPRTMKPTEGNYIEHPDIHEVHSPWLRIQSDTPTPLHADGEIQSEDVRNLEYKILPGRLPILMINKDEVMASIT
jgi:YegS/Rv2252/BmrU family lipid kinase